jgi:hypothetical protein
MSPEVLQHIYLQQMAMMQYMVQQQHHHQDSSSMDMMQNPFMMAAYMQQIHMLQQMSDREQNMFPYPPASMESMSVHSKSVRNYGKNIQQQKNMEHAPSPGSHD